MPFTSLDLTGLPLTADLGFEAIYGMVDDPGICFNYGVALPEIDRAEESLAPLNRCRNLDPIYDNAAIRMSYNMLDQENDHGTRAEELAALFDGLFTQPETKAVVFSQLGRGAVADEQSQS